MSPSTSFHHSRPDADSDKNVLNTIIHSFKLNTFKLKNTRKYSMIAIGYSIGELLNLMTTNLIGFVRLRCILKMSFTKPNTRLACLKNAIVTHILEMLGY